MPLQAPKKKWLTNFGNYILSLRCTLTAQEYWGILFFSCICLFNPLLSLGVVAFIAFKTTRVEMQLSPVPIELPSIVLHIQMNHIQSLIEAIESNPEILYVHHKKQSLLAWCQYYKNPNAQSVITQMMKKHPQSDYPSIAA